MRNTLDVIKERRSIRKFKPEQIKEEELQAIVESGLYAPSAINKQSWNFTVIQNQEILAELNEATKNVARNLDNEALKRIGENEKYNCFYYAPTVILVSGKDEERSKVMDCSAAKYVNCRRVIKYRFLLGRTCELSIYGTTS
jgi:nitroreductase